MGFHTSQRKAEGDEMKVYLAGPMSGYPRFNFPLFYSVTKFLREQGYEVVSPAELDDERQAKIAMASVTGEPGHQEWTWGDFLARDVKIIADGGIEGIILLPGWQRSRGARLEATLGLLHKNIRFLSYVNDGIFPGLHASSRDAVAYQLYVSFIEGAYVATDRG
jgi:hypothetical protein